MPSEQNETGYVPRENRGVSFPAGNIGVTIE